MNPHHFGQLDPDTDPHQSEKYDTDPHQCEKQDPDPHQGDADPQHCSN
jgi:hypothetical protein